jgi:hypothetical protein
MWLEHCRLKPETSMGSIPGSFPHSLFSQCKYLRSLLYIHSPPPPLSQRQYSLPPSNSLFVVERIQAASLLSPVVVDPDMRMSVYMYCPLSYLKHNSLDNRLSIILCHKWYTPLVLKARHLCGSAYILLKLGLPDSVSEQWNGFPLGLGLVVEDKPHIYKYQYNVVYEYVYKT